MLLTQPWSSGFLDPDYGRAVLRQRDPRATEKYQLAINGGPSEEFASQWNLGIGSYSSVVRDVGKVLRKKT